MCAPFHPRVQTAGRAQLLTRQLVFHKPVRVWPSSAPLNPWRLPICSHVSYWASGTASIKELGVHRAGPGCLRSSEAPGLILPGMPQHQLLWTHTLTAGKDWHIANPHCIQMVPSPGQDTYLRKMQKSAKSPNAHTSAYKNVTIIEGVFSGLLFLPLPLASDYFLIGATSKKILLCFSLGAGWRVGGTGQEE